MFFSLLRIIIFWKGCLWCQIRLFISVNFCATNAYSLLHPSSGLQDVLLIEAAIPDELSLLEEVEQQVQHPLGPCVLSCMDKLTNGCVFLLSYSNDIGLWSIFNNEDMCWCGGVDQMARNVGRPVIDVR